MKKLLPLLVMFLFGIEYQSASAFNTSSSVLYTDLSKPDCSNKEKYCKGRKEYSDGRIYEGEFKYGEPHGWGTYTWPNDDIYIGEFVNGLRSGHGQQSFGNGDSYAGEWRDGLIHGKGVYNWVDHSKYVGTFIEGVMQGKGILTLQNGESYDGEWKNGLADGMGEYSKTDGSKYMGKHSEGKRHGNGVISWRTGDVFIGKWKDGNIHKQGSFQFSNGDRYVSIWENGEMTGEATYILVNGKEIKGNPKQIQEEFSDDLEMMEEVGPNLGMTYYVVAQQYLELKRYKLAQNYFELARQYVPASSELNKMIHDQMQILERERPRQGL